MINRLNDQQMRVDTIFKVAKALKAAGTLGEPTSDIEDVGSHERHSLLETARRGAAAPECLEAGEIAMVCRGVLAGFAQDEPEPADIDPAPHREV